MRSRFLTITLAAAFLAAIPVIAEAQNALTTGNVNMRVGPGVQHPVITTVPRGASVYVRGCVRGYSWCDTQWGPYRGWVSARYMTATYPRYRGRPFAEVAPALGIGIVAGIIMREIWRDRDRDVRRTPPPRRWHDRQRSRWEERRWHDRRSSRWRRR